MLNDYIHYSLSIKDICDAKSILLFKRSNDILTIIFLMNISGFEYTTISHIFLAVVVKHLKYSIGTLSFLRNEPQTDSRVSIIHGYADDGDPTRSLPSGKCKKLDKC